MKSRMGLATLGLVAVLITAVVAVVALTGGTSDGTQIGTGGTGGTGASYSFDADRSDRAQSESFPAEEPAAAPFPDVAVGEAGGSGGPATGGSAAGDYAGEGEVAPPLPSTLDRKLVRDAWLTLEVSDITTSVQKVESIAVSAGGFVSSSNVFVSRPPEPLDGEVAQPEPEPTESASVTIRVPASEYPAVMRDLRGIASEVRSESSTTSDVTEEFADLEARQRNLEATEQQYLALLDKAETIPDILSLQDRLNQVRLEIERIQGQINVFNDLSDLATIVVQLAPPLAEADGGSSQGWAEEAWENAWEKSKEVLEGMGTVAIAGAVVLIWLAVPTVVVLAGWRLFGRKAHGGEA
jgi:hypothetical protein